MNHSFKNLKPSQH